MFQILFEIYFPFYSTVDRNGCNHLQFFSSDMFLFQDCIIWCIAFEILISNNLNFVMILFPLLDGTSWPVSINFRDQWRIQAVWETGVRVWAPRLWCFLFPVVFQQKIRWSSDQWFHNASTYFEMASITKMQREENSSETRRSKRKKKLSAKMFSFI